MSPSRSSEPGTPRRCELQCSHQRLGSGWTRISSTGLARLHGAEKAGRWAKFNHFRALTCKKAKKIASAFKYQQSPTIVFTLKRYTSKYLQFSSIEFLQQAFRILLLLTALNVQDHVVRRRLCVRESRGALDTARQCPVLLTCTCKILQVSSQLFQVKR